MLSFALVFEYNHFVKGNCCWIDGKGIIMAAATDIGIDLGTASILAVSYTHLPGFSDR